MKYSKTLQVLLAGLIVSTAVLATSQDDAESSRSMPMMNHGSDMTDHQAMHQMMHMEDGHDMPMMGHSAGNMMNPQMMQQRMEHMQTMEQRLAKIESLLEQILEAQKAQ